MANSDKRQACSAFTRVGDICQHGFLQTPGCVPAACHGCGKPHEEGSWVPWCQRDEFPPHMQWMLDDSGKPKYRESAHE